MEKKLIYYTWSEFNQDVIDLTDQVIKSNFSPEFVMGITRGGACLATVLSYKLNVPAIYFSPKEIDDDYLIYSNRILIVDDIDDTGKTFMAVRKNVEEYEAFQGNPVSYKLLAIHKNLNSKNPHLDFFAHEIDKQEEDWLVYPWEEQF